MKQGNSNITGLRGRKAIRDFELRGCEWVRSMFVELFDVRKHHLSTQMNTDKANHEGEPREQQKALT
jgi:hypothetical protein